MDKNIFESRQLTDYNNGATLMVNLNEFGRFYAQSITVGARFEVDNPKWILNELFPALQDFVYDNNEAGLFALEEPTLNSLTRREKVGIYEMIATASALGWFSKKDAKQK